MTWLLAHSWLPPLAVTVCLWGLFLVIGIFGPHRGPDDAAGLAFVFSLAIGGTGLAWALWAAFWALWWVIGILTGWL